MGPLQGVPGGVAIYWDLSAGEVEAIHIARDALIEAHLAHPDLAMAVAICAVRAASPRMWYRMRQRLDHLEEELGLRNSLDEIILRFEDGGHS